MKNNETFENILIYYSVLMINMIGYCIELPLLEYTNIYCNFAD